jgi:hypothetical protein
MAKNDKKIGNGSYSQIFIKKNMKPVPDKLFLQ